MILQDLFPSSNPSSSPVLASILELELSNVLWLLLGTFALYKVIDHSIDGRAFGTTRRSDVVTPRGIPFLGQLPRAIRMADYHLEGWEMLKRETVGEGQLKDRFFSITIPGARVIDVSKPEYISYIQKEGFGRFHKGKRFFDSMSQVLGEGIFVVDDSKWHVQRKATSKIFNGVNFRGVISNSIQDDLEKLRTYIGKKADAGEPFDFSGLMFKFTLSSFTQMAFGQDLGILDTEDTIPFAAAFDYSQREMSRRMTNPFWPAMELFNGTRRKMKAATKTIDEFAYGIIAQREKEGLNLHAGESKLATDLLGLYMALRDDEGKPLSRKALRDACLNLEIAGRDTTAQALAWTYFHLLDKPELFNAMRNEVDGLKEPVDYDNYKDLHQTLAVFHEGLRLHPSVPENGWQCVEDTQIPNGPFFAKGDLARWSDWAMARDPTVWGEDAKEFKPSRWVDTDGEVKKFGQWQAHMFNGGYRICLGQQLATFEAVTVLAMITKEFDLTFAPGYLENVEWAKLERTPAYDRSLTLPMKEAMMVVAKRRA